MQIYTIQSGDTLFAIARTFNSSVNDIVNANRIPDPERLVVGQTIVIPITGSYYFVQPGDSLWAIGRRFGFNYLRLAEINRINPSAISWTEAFTRCFTRDHSVPPNLLSLGTWPSAPIYF